MTAELDEQLQEKLPGMSKDALRELSQRVNFLLDPSGKGEGKTAKADNPDLEFVYPEYSALLRRAGVCSTIPLNTIIRLTNGDYAKGVAAVMGLVREEFRPKTRVETLKALRVVFKTLYADMRRGKAPIGPKTLAQSMVRVNQAVERSFPSYIACGLLHVLLKNAE